MYVLGTAGHVDHGKSALVKALTGLDPDRWPEERRRGMTIDLGFAWLTLPSGRNVSLVDVPGHERFIKNMLAGVGGLDAVLLVVAADEAVMPQTVEHLAILDLLDVRHGVVVLTKADLVDADWLALVHEEVTGRLQGTSLAAAPLVAVSALTGAGLDLLRTTLDRMLDTTPTRTTLQSIWPRPRLPIDRSFTVSGYGTVVTGTLLDGPLKLGDELVVLPSGGLTRVRGLQTNFHKLDVALPGTRVAVNLAGLDRHEAARGTVLVPPNTLRPTTMLDLRLRVLADAPASLSQNMTLDFFTGTSEMRCRVTLLDAERLDPGASGWVQLRLAGPVVVVRGDRGILRVASPSHTVAGGIVVDAHPPHHRRFRAEVMAALETLARGDPGELLLQALGAGPPRSWAELSTLTGLDEALIRTTATQLVAEGRALRLDELLLTDAGWQHLVAQFTPTLQAYHRQFPLRRGMPREALRQKLQLAAHAFGPYLEATVQRGLAERDETSVWLAGHDPQPSPSEQQALAATLKALAREPYSPPAPNLDGELLAWALDKGLLVRIAPEIWLLPQIYAELLAWVRATIAATGSVTLGSMRDRFGSSRRYALAFLEHLDERKITRRVGEGRVLA
ncbi:MAG: selenocysteine-specific translation elongation factor [Chloroflexales bacterium]